MAIRVILADDHAVVRDGLKLILRSKGIRVLGEASDGRDALRLVRKHSPDAVIMDVSMPGLDGIKATELVREQYPSTEVIMLSMHGEAEYVRRALKAGARGYLLKESAGQEVVDAVKTVAAGERYLSRKVHDTVTDDYLKEGPRAKGRGKLDVLTPRERQVMALVVDDKSSTEIAALLDLSPKTIETYRGRLMSKLGVRTVAGLTKLAISEDLIRRPSVD